MVAAEKKHMAALCIAGTHSGCGKTTVTLGIMSALTKRGLTVQPFKVGPDFIDPGHHRRITGRDSHNLDGWMLERNQNEEIFSRYIQGADIAVVEGVMGVFDGFSGNDESGSTAQMAKWLDIPVVLVIDARSMARSAAAIAQGFALFDSELPISGIIFNRIGSLVHKQIIDEAMSSLLDIPVLGYLPRDEMFNIPSRHLGLVIDEDFRIAEKQKENLAQWIETNLNMELLLENDKSTAVSPLQVKKEGSEKDPVRIGLARDEAFSFYYPENLRYLEEAGAELVPFSPIRSNRLPDNVQGLLLGGGYPELNCRALSENSEMLEAVRRFASEDKPIYAECGGFMYLMQEIHDMDGNVYPMAGIYPVGARMEKKLKALGYREVVTQKESILGPADTKVRGHEFHYSSILEKGTMPDAIYRMSDRKSSAKGPEGFRKQNVLGSYVHLHWGSNPEVANHFVDFCRKYG